MKAANFIGWAALSFVEAKVTMVLASMTWKLTTRCYLRSHSGDWVIMIHLWLLASSRQNTSRMLTFLMPLLIHDRVSRGKYHGC